MSATLRGSVNSGEYGNKTHLLLRIYTIKKWLLPPEQDLCLSWFTGAS